MKLADRRKVIEVLLCCGQNVDGATMTTWKACELSGFDVGPSSDRAWRVVAREERYFRPHGEVCLEAAYRLIESSSTLRREWFSREARR